MKPTPDLESAGPSPVSPVAPVAAPTPAISSAEKRREVIRNAALWITIGALAIAVLTFLISVNAIISTWFREQWAPVARATAALAVVLASAYLLMRIVRMDRRGSR